MGEKILMDVKQAMFQFDETALEKLTEEAVNSGINPLEVIDVLTESVAEIGDRFEKGEMFLPDLMLAAKTMKAGMILLEKEILSRGIEKNSYGKIVIGTVFGDIHDIGKNIVATLLNANNFEVIDLGVNIKAEGFVSAVQEYNPDILAMSALLTTTAPQQEKIISSLTDLGLRDKMKIMVGGGSITKQFAERIGADGYEPTAPLAVKLAKSFINK